MANNSRAETALLTRTFSRVLRRDERTKLHQPHRSRSGPCLRIQYLVENGQWFPNSYSPLSNLLALPPNLLINLQHVSHYTNNPTLHTPTTSSTSQASKPDRRNKPRLYIALYSRGGSTSSFKTSSNCDSYHWALVVGPRTCARSDPGTRYHIAHNPNTSPPFLYEESDILTSTPASTILIRVCIAKVLSVPLLISTLRALPIPLPSKDPSYTCLSWIRAAFTALIADKSILKSYVSVSDWKDIENCARKYCKRKRAQRRFTDLTGSWSPTHVSTYNFWENREIAP